MPIIQTTKIFTTVNNAVQSGYKIVSAQGSSRSSKTYNILIYLLSYILANKKSLSIVRKTLPALKGSVFRDFKEIMQDKFKIWDNRCMNKSEMVYTFPNGSFVEFFSTDDEQKIRGRKRNILYCNEANEISFLEWQQLIMRTTDFSIVDYNPSFSDEHWLCELNKDSRTYHFISTYKDNPFLEQTIIDEIESLEHKNKVLWTVYGLGLQAMAEGLVFPEFEIVDEFPANAKQVAAGLDFGYSSDPTAIVKCGILDGRLYLDEQCYRTHMLTSEIIKELKKLGLFVYADSADPRLIQEIANAGIIIFPADKYKGSVMGGLFKMMEYKLCVTKRSVNYIRELKNYVYEQNKDGKFINQPIDAYNHLIDGTRYYTIGKLLGKVLTSKQYSKEDLGIY
ncbi:PBSX family phage terminase large subunit [Parabacteroides faecis]|uniref:PBSX family phage terminase large subunit n=1 Tax=Parabacteroides faecis TaxID=1217282 RepID=UPI001655660A|nr:PBSX family phage terminase large subunit [Parabacteroides faecis]MBC8619408.1 PBSX family phage terminase large subunit [Parabacteroides faecis]